MWEQRLQAAKNKSPSHFEVVSYPEGTGLYASRGSHKFVFDLEVGKNRQAKKLVLLQIMIHPYTVSIGHGYLKRVVVEWSGKHRFPYQKHLIRKDIELRTTTGFADKASLSIAADG